MSRIPYVCELTVLTSETLRTADVKVLPLNFGFDVDGMRQAGLVKDAERVEAKLRPRPAVFGRVGWYYSRKHRICWVELPSGRCFEEVSGCFLRDLMHFEAINLSRPRLEAVEHRIRSGVASIFETRLYHTATSSEVDWQAMKQNKPVRRWYKPVKGINL